MPACCACLASIRDRGSRDWERFASHRNQPHNAVADAGLLRVPRFDRRSGLTRLETSRVTQDSAEQRRGRAGRLEPGVCSRLWTSAEHQSLAPRRPPEMLDPDLAPLLLELALWGTANPAEL